MNKTEVLDILTKDDYYISEVNRFHARMIRSLRAQGVDDDIIYNASLVSLQGKDI